MNDISAPGAAGGSAAMRPLAARGSADRPPGLAAIPAIRLSRPGAGKLRACALPDMLPAGQTETRP